MHYCWRTRRRYKLELLRFCSSTQAYNISWHIRSTDLDEIFCREVQWNYGHNLTILGHFGCGLDNWCSVPCRGNLCFVPQGPDRLWSMCNRLPASSVFGRWPLWESPVCGLEDEGRKRKETIKFAPFPSLRFHFFPYIPSRKLPVNDSIRESSSHFSEAKTLTPPIPWVHFPGDSDPGREADHWRQSSA
jgi:hypothetical protein